MKHYYRSSLLGLLCVLITAVILLFSSEPSQSNHPKLSFYSDDNYVEGDLIVMLKPGVDIDAFCSSVDNIGLVKKESVYEDFNIWLVGYDQSRSEPVDALMEVMRKPEVSVVQFNHITKERAIPNDAQFGNQWDMHNTGQSGGTPDADIDAPEAWDVATGGVTALGDTIVVAVVDGGFDLAHVDNDYWKNWADIPGNNIDDDNNGYIDDRNGWNAYNSNGTITSSQHGSHVSGTVGARGNNSIGVTGVNWKVKVMPIQGSSGTEAVVLRAYGYAHKNRKLYNQTNGTSGAYVVATNASFGVDFGQPANFPLWCAFYDSLGHVGILSAGAGPNLNVNIDTQGDIPTTCPSNFMIAVTNTTNTDVKNSGAGYGPINMDLGAPGTNILSTNPGNAYGNSTGTSMATPHVAGAVGLMYNAASAYYINYADADPDSIALLFKQYMLSTVDTLASLQTLVLSQGRLNINKLVRKVNIVGPNIMHTPLPAFTENVAGPYTVNCQIIPAGSNIDPSKTRLFWTRTGTFSDSVLMTNTGGNNWTANIPGNGTAANYRYYLKTADLLNRISVLPGNAPTGFFAFTASPDNIRPVITHIGLPDQPRNTWPATVTANITDNLGLDSGWVRWYKNNTGTGIKQFKLTNTSGSTFAAAFNSVMADVSVNDSIFYRVYAQDNSSAHNRDSSAQFKFKIINQATSCIGTGTNSIPYPFNTFWHNNVTEMVYLNSEILGNGGMSGAITKIRYDVLSASGQAMNNFEIKMQHTTNTTVTGFTSTGWTTVYSGTYTVPGTGVQEITLQNPFNYNSSQHLLVQICFDNTSFTSANDIKGTTAANQQFTSYADGQTGCIITGSDPSTSKPNFCFVIQGPNAIQQVGSTIPQEYGLAQNYPNPFNPATTISFSLPKQSLVSLKVFDIAGREVATLVNNTVKTAGIYNVDFDASRLASGVYFYRIQADNFVETKRMMLIK